jgi:hypothetical protein
VIVPHFRSHVALTVWPMAVLFGFGLSQMWPALRGAPSYAASSPASWFSLIAWTLVVLLCLGAYAHGWGRLVLADGEGAAPYRSAGCIRLQKFAGAIAWAFIAGHLVVLWVMTFRVGPVALSHYELLRELLSRPVVLALYMLGLAALGLYLSQGISASLRAWGFGTRPESSRWLEVGCTVASAIMILMAVNILSHFATGRAYWSASSSAAPGVGQSPKPMDEGAP